jgi:hypothetical protein
VRPGAAARPPPVPLWACGLPSNDQGSGDAAAALKALAAVLPDDDVVRFHLARIERGLVSTVIELAEK